MRSLLIPVVAVLFGTALGPVGSAQDPPEDPPRELPNHEVAIFNLDKQGLALAGYDPVAYFEEGGGKPLKGSEKFSLSHRGVTYRFANQKHLDLFKKTPERFEPTYGGWCATALAKDDDLVEIDPKSFLVEGGRLYLFYDGWFADARKVWLKEGTAELSPKSDANWKQRVEKAKQIREEEERKKREAEAKRK
jgi:YHS domain-containing protein